MPSLKSALGAQFLKDLGLNGFSMIARLGSGMVLFVLMARFMGPTGFGEFMYAMTIATIASLPATLGFAPQILRELSANPQAAEDTFRRISRAKLFLAMLVLLGGIAFTVSAPDQHMLFALLLLMALCDSFSEYLFCVLRANGRYAAETRLVLISSVLHCAVVLLVLAWTKEPVAVAIAFLINRAILLFFVSRLSLGSLRTVSLSGRFSEIVVELKRSLAYSIDASLIVLITQLDTVLVRAVTTAADVGVYQAGMRLVLGFQNFTGVAANVFLPKLARAFEKRSNYRKISTTTSVVFAVSGAAVASVLLIGGDFLVRNVYGSAYLKLLGLMPFLAVLVFIRFCGSGFGIQLTAMGEQKSRTLVNACALLTMVVFVVVLAPRFGLEGVMAAVILSGILVLAAYAILVGRKLA